MTIGRLLRRFDPRWKVRNIMIVGDECELQGITCLKAEQQVACMRDGESVLRCLCEHPDEPKFGNRTSCQFRNSPRCQSAHPASHSPVEFVLQESQRDQRIHVEEIRHGNSAKISRTCLLLNTGAFGPALSTGRPVIGSTTIFTFPERVRCGVSTMRPPSTFVSSGSPVRRPNFRRT
jgi:hypothetical protein